MRLSLEGAGYRYPSGVEVGPVDLHVEAGELVLLTGPTGCGKSTVLRLAAGLAQRQGQGEVLGSIRVDGVDPGTWTPKESVARIGFVSQSPRDQVVAGRMGDEVAFPLESACWEPDAIRTRVLEMLAQHGLPPEPDRSCVALSGGQCQRLVLASGLAGGGGLLLLDEPLAQLDPRGAESLLQELVRLVREHNLAVLLVEHRLEQALEYSDRVLVMDEGRIVCEGPSDRPPLGEMASRGLQLPGLLELDTRLAARGLSREDLVGTPIEAPVLPGGTPHLEGRNLGFSFGSETALSGVDFQVKPGERLAIVGGNGAGKSTLLSVLSGDLDGGEVQRNGRLVDVPQEPDLALFCATVHEELAHGPREAGSPDVEKEVQEAAEALGVLDLLDRPPQALSRGQRMRVAVAAALAAGPDILVLDEPTSGQDRGQVEQMMHSLAAHLGDRSLVFATHDLDLVSRHATRVLVLEAGRCIADGEPARVLADLPENGPLVLPPLARLCLDKGWQPASARALVERS